MHAGNEVEAYRLLALKGALKLECLGMKRSRSPSAYAMVKREFGLKGTKEKVLELYTELLKQKGILKS